MIVTRFPPEPNGYLHIGHAKAAIVDYEYAKMYDGKFILRFDDTNPENAHLEFYNSQKEDILWLGIKWDKEYNTSDNLEKHYKLAEQLIKQGDAYVCTCDSDVIKECRFNGKDCDCRHIDSGESLDIWKEMIYSSYTGAILRLKGDMTCDNTAMRDPTLFRIIEKEHPIQGDKYRVWPTYDFSGAIEDSISGVSHPFRTKEYELRDECYYKILDLLGLRKPHLMEFARLSIEGMPVSKRKIKPLIESGFVSGYDDIRLPTLRGLKKRGILPKAIKQFVLEQGISKVESSVSFSLLEAANRKIIDPITKRYFFVSDPIKLVIDNAPQKEKKIDFHPRDDKLGSRLIKTDKIFYVEKQDIDRLNIGDIFRLKDLYNVKIKKKNSQVIGEHAGEKLIPESTKIQWTMDKYVNLSVYIPHLLYIDGKFNNNSLERIDGYAEEAVTKINTNEIIQFERFGFVRIENDKNKIKGYFSHK
jgi:glutamyl-tRNA synthetase